RDIAGVVSVSEDGRRVQFRPEVGLTAGHKYTAYVSYSYFLLDLAGNRVGNYHSFAFTAGAENDSSVPVYRSSNIGASLGDVAVNTPLRVIFDEALAPHCINSSTVVLFDGQNTISGSVSLDSSYTEITFVPSEALSANTNYSLRIENGCDVAGNAFSGEVLNFTTSVSDAADTIAPRIVSISPANGSSGVSVTSEIVVTFTESLDARNIEKIARIYMSGQGGDISGDYTLIDNVLRFVPTNPLPGSTVINTQLYHFKDAVGNNSCCWNYSFTTEAEFDTQAPTVTAISPSDGAMDIGVNTPVVLTFSESLNASTINNTHFKLFSDGAIINPSVQRSSDGRTVTLRGTWPAGKAMSVIVTNNVKDLSNNALSDYVSLFSTAVVNTDRIRPTVARLYPNNGASNVPSVNSIVMYTSEAMNESTLADAFHIAENGVLINGTLSVSASGQSIEFTPDNAFAEGALIHVYLDSTAQDSQGNAMTNYQGSFRMAAAASSIGTRPSTSSYIPANGVKNVALNPNLQVVYNQDMDETTITDSLIVLRKDGGEVLTSAVSLGADKRTVTIEPAELLETDTYYYVSLSGNITDVDGDRQYWSRSYSFTTAVDGVEDLQQPIVLAMSPATGMTNVPLNPRYHVQFDEPINPASFSRQQDMSVSFSSNNQEVMYARYTPLIADTDYTETLSSVTDIAGNLMVAHSELFATGTAPDIITPNYQSYTPYANSVVARNSSVTWVMNEELDPVSVNDNTVYVQDRDNGSTRVAGNVGLASDGQTVHWVPEENLLAGRRYRAYIAGVTDISGNTNSADAFYFSTNLEEDIVAPVVTDTSVKADLIDVATNARVRIKFSEAVSNLSFADVDLMVLGEKQAVSYTLDSTRKLLTLTPLTLLPAHRQVTLKVDGVKDLAGNAQTKAYEINFTTGSGIDTQTGTVVNFSPRNGAVDVALNSIVTVDFNERIDPTSVTTQSVRVYNHTESRDIAGVVSVSEDGRRVQFRPEVGLTAGHKYTAYVSYSYFLLDLAGNR
ncbi:MAG: Ig-like domain-containing protein, partial [Alteromonas sp.]|nr:Ig-like domain-containing protein [Alteromonas sp.]